MDKRITIEEVIKMAEAAGLEVLEDFVVSIASDTKNFALFHSGFQTKPPYETLYSKKDVEMIIEILTK